MNIVILTGRVTKDPQVRYTPSQTAVATFTIAVDRPVKAEAEKQADFPRITVFGKQAEICEKYIGKGSKIAIEGRIQTGKYEKNGETVYTTDVIANRVEFLDNRKMMGEQHTEHTNTGQTYPEQYPEQFAQVDEDVPF